MDRLQVVSVLVLLLAGPGCEDTDEEHEPAEEASRVVAVAKKNVQRSPEAFCDTYAPGEGAKVFEAPPLADDAALPKGGWRWVNLWATWCKPCIEEMPLLEEWKAKLAAEGADVELVFLSVDESAEQVARFREKHPQTPESLRIDSLEALPEFLAEVGLDENTPIPVQIFVGSDDAVRCVRAGAVGPDDYSAVKRILL
ncbi:MAG: TlpA family protein disulfide reductase [Myxococcota bacterium]